MTRSIKLVGVGGQGTILAAKVLCDALINAGYDVKMSEIHGMSQRGGSVSSEIRFGDEVYSPVIEKGKADVLIAFELMEAERALDYLSKDGLLIVNNHKINSMVTLNGKVPYPEGIVEDLKSKVNTVVVNASDEAIALGNAKVMNIMMLGALVNADDLHTLDIEQSIENTVKEKFISLNKQAFQKGKEL